MGELSPAAGGPLMPKIGDTKLLVFDGDDWIPAYEDDGAPEIRVGTWVRFHRNVTDLDRIAAEVDGDDPDIVEDGVGPVTGMTLSGNGRDGWDGWDVAIEVALPTPGQTAVIWPDMGDTIALAFQ